MTEHIMTRDASAISIRAFAHATRLGHPCLGGEHYLLALSAAAQPAGAVLREHGVTPERAEAEIVRLSGAGLFGDLDRDALTTVGIDVDAVRAATEASFGPATLARAARDVHRGPGRFSPRRRSGATRGDGVFLPHGPGVNQALVSAPPGGWGPARRPGGRRGRRTGHPRRQRGTGALDPVAARHIRASTEHRDPGPLPARKLTRRSPGHGGPP
jgi:Clp amino terminal domain, pathogenicity island component